MEPEPNTPLRLKIVVVEDDNTVRLFLKNTLEKELGHQVVDEAESGTDMVRKVLALEPDVVVFDIHLPRLNGLDALRQIYQERVVAAVAITADRDQELVHEPWKNTFWPSLSNLSKVTSSALPSWLPGHASRKCGNSCRKTPRFGKTCKTARSLSGPRACS